MREITTALIPLSRILRASAGGATGAVALRLASAVSLATIKAASGQRSPLFANGAASLSTLKQATPSRCLGFPSRIGMAGGLSLIFTGVALAVSRKGITDTVAGR
jgi:hypothetical protein